MKNNIGKLQTLQTNLININYTHRVTKKVIIFSNQKVMSSHFKLLLKSKI